jgi:hypothetical protein
LASAWVVSLDDCVGFACGGIVFLGDGALEFVMNGVDHGIERYHARERRKPAQQHRVRQRPPQMLQCNIARLEHDEMATRQSGRNLADA